MITILLLQNVLAGYRPVVHQVTVSLEKATMGAFNRLSAARGLSARLQVKGLYSSFLTTVNVYVDTGRYITNELYIGAYVTCKRTTKALRGKQAEREREKKREGVCVRIGRMNPDE